MPPEVLDINSCSPQELVEFTGIDQNQADEVIRYRESKGAFYHLSEILEVPGMDKSGFVRISGIDPIRADGFLIRHQIKNITKLNKASAYSFKEITKMISKLPGIDGAILCSEDGLPISSDFDPMLPADKIGASLSACLKQVADTLSGAGIGNVKSLSLEMAGHVMTAFHSGKLYLVVLHHRGQVSGIVNDTCARILRYLPQAGLGH